VDLPGRRLVAAPPEEIVVQPGEEPEEG